MENSTNFYGNFAEILDGMTSSETVGDIKLLINVDNYYYGAIYFDSIRPKLGENNVPIVGEYMLSDNKVGSYFVIDINDIVCISQYKEIQTECNHFHLVTDHIYHYLITVELCKGNKDE